jgi:hypothetical protein
MFIPAFVMTAVVAAPAFAQQQAASPQAQGQAQGQALGQTAPMGGLQALRAAQARLQQAAQRYRQAAEGGDQQQVEQVTTEIQQAVDEVRQAMSQLSPQERAQVQERLRQAQQGLQLHDTRARLEALDRLMLVAGEEGERVRALTEDRLRQLMAQVGFENVQILESSYLVEARTANGEPVVMFVNPHLGTATGSTAVGGATGAGVSAPSSSGGSAQ